MKARTILCGLMLMLLFAIVATAQTQTASPQRPSRPQTAPRTPSPQAGQEQFFAEVGVPVATRTAPPPKLDVKQQAEFRQKLRN